MIEVIQNTGNIGEDANPVATTATFEDTKSPRQKLPRSKLSFTKIQGNRYRAFVRTPEGRISKATMLTGQELYVFLHFSKLARQLKTNLHELRDNLLLSPTSPFENTTESDATLLALNEKIHVWGIGFQLDKENSLSLEKHTATTKPLNLPPYTYQPSLEQQQKEKGIKQRVHGASHYGARS